MSNDSLGDRMKGYERVNRSFLTKRTPVIVRVDGRAFHTLTKQCVKPFDIQLMMAMTASAAAVASDMQGFKLGYTQSDEASFLITDYDNIGTQGWFDYNLSKIVSLSASIMTATFNSLFKSKILATFDARAFNIPEADVANYFLWRQKDWERNSLQMYCRSFFSHKELENKNREDMHEMLYETGRNWTRNCSGREKNGTYLLENGSHEKYCVKPSYPDVSDLVNSVL
jgi:tRNA(His) 5'-end guanylyltransferase